MESASLFLDRLLSAERQGGGTKRFDVRAWMLESYFESAINSECGCEIGEEWAWAADAC